MSLILGRSSWRVLQRQYKALIGSNDTSSAHKLFGAPFLSFPNPLHYNFGDFGLTPRQKKGSIGRPYSSEPRLYRIEVTAT